MAVARRAGLLVTAGAVAQILSAAAATRCDAAEAPRLTPRLLPDIGLERLPPSGTPAAPPDIPVPAAPVAPPPAIAGPRFAITAVSIEGSTVYSEADLRAYYETVLTAPSTLADLQAVARAIEQRYRQDGYLLVRVIVPPQTIEGGRVRIVVIEGGIAGIDIEGDVGPVSTLILSYLEPARRERPLKLATLERGLLLANDIPGVSVSASLKPSPQQVGAADLTLAATRAPFNGSTLVDNFGDDYTGRWEGAASVFSNSWTAGGERIALTGFVTEPWNSDNQWVGQLATSFRPPGGDGLSLESVVSYGESYPGSQVSAFGLIGTTFLAAGAVSYPLVRSRRLTFAVSAGFDYINSKTDSDLLPSDDKLRIAAFKTVTSFDDPLGGTTSIETELRQGLPILNATRRSDDETSRPDGTAQSTTLGGSLSRQQPLVGDLSFYTAFAGQYAFTPLLANEQFNLGGTNFGRGYPFDQISGDSGIGGTAELRYDLFPRLSFLDRVQLFTFFDGGRVWDRSEIPDNSLSSTGAGVRLQPISQLSLELQVAKPLTLDSDRSNGARDPQFLFRAISWL